jgi:hypothetical protein
VRLGVMSLGEYRNSCHWDGTHGVRAFVLMLLPSPQSQRPASHQPSTRTHAQRRTGGARSAPGIHGCGDSAPPAISTGRLSRPSRADPIGENSAPRKARQRGKPVGRSARARRLRLPRRDVARTERVAAQRADAALVAACPCRRAAGSLSATGAPGTRPPLSLREDGLSVRSSRPRFAQRGQRSLAHDRGTSAASHEPAYVRARFECGGRGSRYRLLRTPRAPSAATSARRCRRRRGRGGRSGSLLAIAAGRPRA